MFIMGKALKVAAALGVAAAGTAAILALKKRKELEDYDYEELDEDFDECLDDCEETAEETAEQAAETTDDVEADLDKVEEAVEEVDE